MLSSNKYIHNTTLFVFSLLYLFLKNIFLYFVQSNLLF